MLLADGAIRDGIKTYSNWPTIAQLYVKNEFIGGCDITREMFRYWRTCRAFWTRKAFRTV